MILRPSKIFTTDCYVDVDFSGQWNVKNPDDPLCVKSHTGYVLLVGNCPVHWVSQMQTEVAVSTMEAEYIMLSTDMHDLIPLRNLLDEVKELMNADMFSKVFEDNNGAFILATTPCMTQWSKHIAVKYHFFKEHVGQGKIHIEKVTLDNQIADCLTKGLDKTLFECACLILVGW